MSKRLVYGKAGEKERIDRYLSEELNVSRERIKKLLKGGRILVSGRTVLPSHLLHPDDEITIDESGSLVCDDTLIRPENGRMDVLYEDSDIVVVNKPSGILTHPTNRILTGTLVNFLLYQTTLSSKGLPFRPGVVHRLDKETSGVIVFARTDSAFDSLVRQFQNRQVEKEYLAVVQGRFEPLKVQIEFTVTPDRDDYTRMEVHYLRGKKALTSLEVIRYLDNLTVVKAKPITGRTHQIRVTLMHLGYPVIGDLKYGVKSDLINRVALHSHSITLTLPSTGRRMNFTAPVPDDLRRIVDSC